MQTILTEIETFIFPILGSILKQVVKDPAKYANLKGVFQSILTYAQEAVTDLQTIIAGM